MFHFFIVGITKDTETQNQIVGGLKSVSMVSSKLLLAAKSVSVDPNAPNAKNLLAQAARYVLAKQNLSNCSLIFHIKSNMSIAA